MLAWRAARTAARSRGLVLGSGRPERAAVVNSRMILVKTLARFLSCAPFRYMMFLNCEWPAISAAPPQARPNKPIWQDWGDSGCNTCTLQAWHMRREPAAEAHRLDMAGQPGPIVAF